MRKSTVSLVATAAIIFSLAGCATPLKGFDNAYRVEGDDKIIAFVGRKVAVAMLVSDDDTASEDSDTVVINLDLGFAARYEIIELVHGHYDRKFIDFEAYDHYGYPKFANEPMALIYLVESGGRLFHWKYQWDRVYPTADGRFAGCGDPYFDLDEEEKLLIDERDLEPIKYKPPVTFRISDKLIRASRRPDLTREDIDEHNKRIRGMYSPPAFDVRGDRATCRMGAYPDELYRIRNQATFLPAIFRETCENEIGYSPTDWQNEQKRSELNACISEKTANRAP